MATLVSVQYLRAFAALIVVYYHVFSNHVAAAWAGGDNAGLIGVDIFFVISGFIMWVSTSHQAGGVWKFLKRRACRIYPLWWIALSLWIAMRMVLPDRLHGGDVTLPATICSYLLLPHYHAVFAGRIWPILVPGWTLQLEIFFYLLFGLSLLIASRLLRLSGILGALCLLTIAGLVLAPASAVLSDYTNPLLLEFGAGVGLAALLPLLRRVPSGFGAAAILLGLGSVLVDYHHIVDAGLARVAVLGLPAVLIVGGALVLEPLLARTRHKLPLLLGDASYSLYLTHSVAISAAAVLWERLHLPQGARAGAIGFIPVAIGAAVIFAVLVYKFVEQPLLNWLIYRRRDGAQLGALPAAALAEEGLAETPLAEALEPSPLNRLA